MYELFIKLTEIIDSFGYIGLFFMTFIESTFVPIPSEVTVIPAGYLVAKGDMNLVLAYTSCVAGTVAGSLFNYYIALHYGRYLFLKYGKYFFMNEEKLRAIEFFFERHGAISTFSGRLLPGIKHVISFPAGLAKMDVKLFAFYTTLGAMIWNFILLMVGYFIGQNDLLIKKYIKQINIIMILSLLFLFWIYYLRVRKKS